MYHICQTPLSPYKSKMLCILVGHFYIVEKYKMIVCINWKSASTSLRWLIFNNTFPDPLPATYPNEHKFGEIVQNASKLGYMNMLKSYT